MVEDRPVENVQQVFQQAAQLATWQPGMKALCH